MATSAARAETPKAAADKKGGKLRLAPEPVETEVPRGDPSLTLEAMAGWKPGQKRCRGRKRHNWGPYNVYEHADWYEVIEQCSHCRNRRWAEFVPTQRGVRKVSKWHPDYREGYLLPKGAARLDEDLQDELTAEDILSRRIIEVLDEDEED